MNNTIRVAGSAVLCFTGMILPLGLSAEPDFKFTYLQAVYTAFDRDVADGDGYGIDGSYHFDNGILLGGGVGKTDFDDAFEGRADDLESTYYYATLGYAENWSDRIALSAKVGYARGKTDSSQREFDNIREETQFVEGEVRVWLFPGWLEGHGSAAALRFGSEGVSETGAQYRAGLRLHVVPQFLVGVSVARTFLLEDTDSVTAELRLQF